MLQTFLSSRRFPVGWEKGTKSKQHLGRGTGARPSPAGGWVPARAKSPFPRSSSSCGILWHRWRWERHWLCRAWPTQPSSRRRQGWRLRGRTRWLLKQGKWPPHRGLCGWVVGRFCASMCWELPGGSMGYGYAGFLGRAWAKE